MPIDEILATLESAETTSSFCAEKKIDSKNFDIKLNKIGTLEFPLQEDQIKALISVAKPAKFGWKDQTILDQTVRNAWEIPANKIKIGKKQWDGKFITVLQFFKNALGLPKKSTLTAELHNMLIYEPGCFFKPHQDSEKVDGMVATLVIVLPTKHEGGELIIDHQGVKKTFKPSGTSSVNQLLSIAFYADCYHEVKEVSAGYRVSLTYNLILGKYTGHMDSLFDSNFESRLEKVLTHHFFPAAENVSTTYTLTAPKLVYLLDHQYTQQSLSWNGLKNMDQTRVNTLLKIADKLDLTAHLVLADLKETWDCEFDYDEYRYHRKRGYEPEEEGTPTYLMATEATLRHWLSREGNVVAAYNDFSPGHNEVCWTGSSEKLTPYQSEYEGWMGNYGNTLDRWYHRAAIILWRKNDHYSILFEMNSEAFVQEIFALAKSSQKLSELHERLKYTAHYWVNYARNHRTVEDMLNTLNLAFILNNPDISFLMLKTYELTIFEVKTASLWSQLAALYGSAWFIRLFTALTEKQRRTDRISISHFSDFIQLLCKQKVHMDIIHVLLEYQFNILKENHQSPRLTWNVKIQGTRCAPEMIDFILGTIYAQNHHAHLKAIQDVIEHPANYPAFQLMLLLENAAEHLKKIDIKNCDYPRLFEHISREINKEYESGLRSKNDWSISIHSQCSCKDCQTLNHFLNQSMEQQKIWPLTEGPRAHITGEIEKLYLPIGIKIEKNGRPYKLILTKKDSLHTDAKNRYQTIEKIMNKLEQFSSKKTFI